jgi:hypothetical protein
MASPTRWPSGITQAASWQPLGQIGIPDPFFYVTYEDDFIRYNAGDYTVTATGGSVAATAANGSGGRVLFTTGATAGNFAEIQLTAAPFQVVAGKKLAFMTRFRVTSGTTSAVIAGLIATSATPFTAVADGIYLNKPAASTTMSLIAVTGSTVVGTVALPTAIANGADVDVGFYLDRSGNIQVFQGVDLEGARRQDYATLVPNVSIRASALTGALTSVLLNPTLAISNGATAAAMTGVFDFSFAAQER